VVEGNPFVDVVKEEDGVFMNELANVFKGFGKKSASTQRWEREST